MNVASCNTIVLYMVIILLSLTLTYFITKKEFIRDDSEYDLNIITAEDLE